MTTGNLESAPGMDGLPVFKVEEKDGKHFVHVPLPLPNKQTHALAKRDPDNKKRFVIIGGGPAGHTAAETLRQSDFTGEILIISGEDVVAYDRTLLSKNVTGAEV